MAKKNFKIIVIGKSGAGKTSLVRKFSREKFTPNYNMTIGIEFESKEIQIEDQQVQLQIWDTVSSKGRAGEVQVAHPDLLPQLALRHPGLLDQRVT